MKDLPLTPPDFFTPFLRTAGYSPEFCRLTASARHVGIRPSVFSSEHGQKIPSFCF